MSRNLLITQCLQNDFVQLIEKYEPLPNQLHIGYAEARRLLGEHVEEGPVYSMMNWAYSIPEEELGIIHIRDWHNANDPLQKDHLRQFGSHCIQDSPGADFVFRKSIREDRSHHIVNASGLNDFVETDLINVLRPYQNETIRVGIAGVWTEAKVTFLAYDLKTRFPNFEIAVCSALTASSSRTMHFVALDQLKSILGVQVFSSIGTFANYLTGRQPSIDSTLNARVDETKLRIKDDYPISEIDKKLLLYMFRDAKEVDLIGLDGGFSGNVVLRAKSVDILGHTQVPTVIKIGQRDAIAQERTSFERIQEVLGNNAPAVVDFAELSDRGGIKYRYAAMLEGKVITFQDFYANTTATEKIVEILDIVFSKQLGKLYEAGSIETLDLLKYYDFNSKYAAGVRRRVEALIGSKADQATLNLPYAENEIPNLCHFYEKDLTHLAEYNAAQRSMAYVHGDLNGRNIILDAHLNVWMIDFFHTHRGHILKDLIKLENDILYIFSSIENSDELPQAYSLSDYLYSVIDLGAELPVSPPPNVTAAQLVKAYQVIRFLRSLYPDLVGLDRDPYQLFVGALRYSVHTLAFDESTEKQRIWALYTSCILSKKIKTALLASKQLRVDYLQIKGLSSRIGITILPGRKDRNRILTEDIDQLKNEGIKSVLCLLTENEFSQYGVEELKSAYTEAKMESLYLPILDQAAPNLEDLNKALEWMDLRLKSGALLVHCVGGLGRSGTVVAAYLITKEHLSVSDAIARVRESRSQRAIESKRQEEFLHSLGAMPGTPKE